MDYLRTLGSAAVSAVVAKSGLNLPFSLGAKVTNLDGICNLYDATKRDDGSAVSVFEYDFTEQARRNVRPFATNAVKKLRTTRHPDVLKFMDSVETDSYVYIMTERVRPLESVLQAWASRDAKEREEWLIWGLHRISVALTFLNDPCNSTHGKIAVNSVFISPSGEWKLGGFELFSNPRDETSILYTHGGAYPHSSSWASPEVKASGWSILKSHEPPAADAYALGLLIHSVFNPTQPLPATANPPHPPPAPSSRGAIPTSIFPHFKNLLNPNPKGRLTAKGFLAIGIVDTGFFGANKLVRVCAGLENFSLASEAEKNQLLRSLKESVSSFPAEFASKHVLPSLVSALEFGGASASSILPLVLQIGANIPPEDYPTVILVPVTKLFASPDRGTRMALLDHLGEYIDKLDKKTVSDKIFPHLSTGFTDTVAVIREATVKSIIQFAPLFTERILNNDLLRHLARAQADQEPSIRTNTCILIGRLAPTLGYNTKKKVLVPAFMRAIKDTFVHARIAGVMGFIAAVECFDAEDIATKVIPNLASAMIDKEKVVRDPAFKAVNLYVKKLEQHAATMPETVLTDPNDPNSAPAVDQGMLANVAAGAAGHAGTLAGWALSSLGKKLVTTDLQTSMTTVDADRPMSAPPQASLTPTTPHMNRTHSVPQSMPGGLSSPAPKAKGMQLGGTKPTTSDLAASVLAEESTTSENLWGNDDLIDINADQDDWGAFETAPATSKPRVVGLGTSSSGYSNGGPASPPASVRTPSRVPTPVSPLSVERSPKPSGNSLKPPSVTPVASTAGMSKEEKAAEMARRKEERKQRIAALKEQKRAANQ